MDRRVPDDSLAAIKPAVPVAIQDEPIVFPHNGMPPSLQKRQNRLLYGLLHVLIRPHCLFLFTTYRTNSTYPIIMRDDASTIV
jgi:hypothetical protein